MIMKCSECAGKQKTTRTKMYHFIESGLTNVYLCGITVRECSDCGEIEAEIPNIEGLHTEIAKAISNKENNVTPKEFRFLRTYLGYSSKDFAKAIGISAAEISRWENGNVKIPSTIDLLIRHMALINKKNRNYTVTDLSDIIETRQKLGKIIMCLKSNSWQLKVA